jgi:phosphatidylinositol alpha-1,6-mannosyltransferase
MITELFLPTKGGTAVSFDDDFSRLGGKEVHIVTADVPGAVEFDRTHPNTIHRLTLKRSPWLRPESLFIYSKLFFRSLRLAMRYRFAAVLAGRALPEGIVAWAVARLRGCPVFIYAHGEELTGWGRGRKFQTMCFALRHADMVLANSDFTRETLISLIGVAPERIALTYPTVDVERYHPALPCDDLRASVGIGPAQRLILSVGRLQRRKGFDQAIRALPGLVARGLDAHYALIGIGEDWDYLQHIAQELGVRDRVHLLGHVSADDLPRWYNACEVFVMPNRDIGGDTEGFGLVFLEAGASGKPVIAGRAGGTGSAVEDGITGLRVDGEKPEEVEAAIAHILSTPHEAHAMGLAGRGRTAARFTSDRRAEQIRQLIVGSRPFRVLMYTAYFDPEYSGAALQALTLAKSLRRRGHHVEFVTNRWRGLEQWSEVDGFKVRRVEPGRWRKHREFRLWLFLGAYVLSRRRDFDILHSHGAYYSCAIVGPLAKLTGLQSLAKASLANDDLQDLGRPIVGRLHRFMLRHVGAYVAISHDLVREFEAGGLDKAKIHYLPNGVDTDRFSPPTAAGRADLRTRLGLPSDRPILLYVGVLDERKNIQWLAEKWMAHAAFGTNALLLAIGPQSREDRDGTLRNRLLALTQSNPDRFLLHDFVADIVPYYQSADALVLPSLKEGLPNVVLEAMACGLPCIAARASGSRELIVDGETGYTYAHGNVHELADAVRLCLSANGSRLGRQARAQAQKTYAIDVIAERYEGLYGQLLHRPAPRTTAVRCCGESTN